MFNCIQEAVEQPVNTDPVADKDGVKPIDASNPNILQSIIAANEIHLYESSEQHANWLDCVRSRKETAAPVEIAHRACTTCLLHHMAMKAKRKLHWDPVKERFHNDPDADKLLSRPQRAPYGYEA